MTTVEQQMCNNNWNKINYNDVPLGAIKKYGKIDKIIIINSNKFLETTINFLKPFIGNEILQKTFVYDNIKLAFIGPGIPLLFTFMRNCIILLFSVVVIFVAFAFYSNYKGGNC